MMQFVKCSQDKR